MPVAGPRFRTLLFAVFAGLAVCLAMAGIYGVMAYAVATAGHSPGRGVNTGETIVEVGKRAVKVVEDGSVPDGEAYATAIPQVV